MHHDPSGEPRRAFVAAKEAASKGSDKGSAKGSGEGSGHVKYEHREGRRDALR
jgi:hypothetical protein